MHDFQREIDYRYGEGYAVISSEGGVRGTMVVRHDCGHQWECSPRTINGTRITEEVFCPSCRKMLVDQRVRTRIEKATNQKWLTRLNLDNGVQFVGYTGEDRKLNFICEVCSSSFYYTDKRYPKKVKCRVCERAVNKLERSLPEDLAIVSVAKNSEKKARTYITIRHNSPSCDYAEFTTRLDVFTKSEPRCYICERMQREPVSKPVRDLSNYFDNKGISYRREVSLPDCVNPLTSYPLRFDFEVETPTGLKYIEYDGEQHFMQVEGWESIESTRFRDQIKDCYCARNNIPLLRIPYTELSSMYTIVNNFLTHT